MFPDGPIDRGEGDTSVSERAPHQVAQEVDKAPAVGARRFWASAAYWLVLAAGAVVTLVAIPFTAVFLSSSEATFWVLAALAVAADIRPVRLPPPLRRSTTFVVSMCFCFAILLLWGTGPAVVVQVAAVAVAGRRLHLNWWAWAYLTSRLVISFAAAGLVARVLGVSGLEERLPLSGSRVLDLTLVALVFLAVSCTISVVGALLSGATLGEVAAQVRFEVLARGSVLVLGAVIATTASVWSLLLLFVPIVGWSQLARLLSDQDRQLEHDPVTGLLSRHGLEVAMLYLPREHRRDTDWFAVILVQLRGMAYVSRNFGRNTVEHLMITVTSRLQEAARPSDLIGRLSDSQFMLLRSGVSSEEAADAARGLVRALSDPVASREGIPFRLDPVAGVAVAPQHGHLLGQLLPHAETALFGATFHRQLATVFAPETPSEVDDRLALLGTLSAAVNDPQYASQIVLLYQPQVDVATGRSDSVEALLRWHHPERGLIPTDELIRVVEPTGVMQQLTRYVLNRAVAQLAEWNRAGLRLRVAVNVSVLDLSTNDFDAEVDDILRRYGIAPNQLDLEITERSVVDDPRPLDDAAQRIAKIGVGLSLDDFGTGFASLRRLSRLPLSEVKIDRSYVGRIAQSAPDRAIVTAVHDLADVLGLRLVAEGVEDEATVHVLAQLDRVIGQGWYYARPMPAPQLIDWLRQRGTSSDGSMDPGASTRRDAG